MRLNHADVVLDFLGQPLPCAALYGPACPTPDAELTFHELATAVLLAMPKDEQQQVDPKTRFYLFNLTGKFFRGRFARLDGEEAKFDEVAFLRERAGMILQSPLLYGRMCEWLEGKPQTVATDLDEDDELKKSY